MLSTVNYLCKTLGRQGHEKVLLFSLNKVEVRRTASNFYCPCHPKWSESLCSVMWKKGLESPSKKTKYNEIIGKHDNGSNTKDDLLSMSDSDLIIVFLVSGDPPGSQEMDCKNRGSLLGVPPGSQ